MSIIYLPFLSSTPQCRTWCPFRCARGPRLSLITVCVVRAHMYDITKDTYIEDSYRIDSNMPFYVQCRSWVSLRVLDVGMPWDVARWVTVDCWSIQCGLSDHFSGGTAGTAICSKVACQKKPCCRTAMGLVGNFCHFGPVVLCFVPFSGMLILSCWNRVTGGWIMMMHPSPKKLWVLGFAGSQAICSQQLQPREFGNRSSFVVESSYQRNSDQTNY